MKKVRNITAHIQKILKIVKKAFQNVKKTMIKSADKKRKEIIYNPGDLIFLFNRNIKTVKPSKKLNDKILGFFKILKTVKTFYRF
jgi:hypothetical protein